MRRPAGLDVLVVGAGPSGLTLALQARDHGATVRVVERRTEPFRPSRALIVHPRTLEVLRPLGVTEALLARGEAAPWVCLHLGSRTLTVGLGGFPLADTAFPHLLFEPQAAVEAVLAAALAARGVDVERGVELTDAAGDGEGALAVLSGAGAPEQVRCRYLVGCDGASSTVRRLAGLGWRGAPYRQEMVLADLELAGELPAGVAHAFAAESGVLFLFALGEGATWRMLASRTAGGSDGDAGARVAVPARDLQRLLDGAGLALRVGDVAWSARAPLQHRIASHYRRGPLFLVGDAAHAHSPAGGQGMNTGVQDAANLGWKLAFAASGTSAGSPAEAALLDSYEAERRPVARRVLALTHALFWGEAGTDPVARLLRSRLAGLGAPAVPFLLGRRRLLGAGVRILSQLSVQYRASTLSVEGTPSARRGPRPGERLPDAEVTVSGGRRRLHELIAAPGVHLLLERDAESPRADLGGLVSVERVASWDGRGALLVRPDGYVGLRSSTGDSGEIASWLALVGGAGTRRRPGARAG